MLFFTCDLLTTERDKQLVEAIITVAAFGIPCTCDGASVMAYLRFITCDGNKK